MPIPTEPIGSIPRPAVLIEGTRDFGAGRISHEQWRSLCYADYRRLFGGEPPRIAGIAVMIDTDDTGVRAVAHYGRITLRATD